VRLRRHSELQRHYARALDAATRGEWWDGTKWRAPGETPRDIAEALAYKTAHDMLADLSREMISDGPPNGDARAAAATRFSQSTRARSGEETAREKASLTAWNTLVAAYGEPTMLSASLGERFLGDCATTLEDAKVPSAECGADWLGKGNYRVRDLIRRHRKRLQPPA
jgi:hypothetical protein